MYIAFFKKNINIYDFVLQKLHRTIQYFSKFNRRKLIIEIRPDYKNWYRML